MMKSVTNSALIIAESGILKGKRWFLSEDLVIGREADCDLLINDRQVSRRHAKISLQNNKYILEDLNSKNGTFLNKKKINKPEILKEGDTILIGIVQELLFFSSDSTIPLDNLELFIRRLHVDEDAKKVWINKEIVDPPISHQQFQLLLCLYKNQGNIVPREEIINAVWQNSFEEGVSNEALDALVRRLRKRIAEYDKSHEYVKTVRGFGFQLENPRK